MGYRFLIVDPSATMRALIKRTIRQSSLPAERFFEATTGLETLDILAHQRIDLVLIDPALPDVDGIELIGRIATEPGTRGTPVIAMAARPIKSTLALLRRHGVRQQLRKPIDGAAFYAAAAELLEPTHV